MNQPQSQSSNICDYEGSDYKTRFWQNADRAYEDAVERVAIGRLLPPKGRRIIEFGAGFGRLADLYTGYDEIILLDYSRTLLEQAMEKWGSDPRFKFIAADIYHLPFAEGIFDAATMIRVIHHIADVPAALAQIRRAMAAGSTFVFEFANKRNLKSIARYLVRKQDWNPYAPEPVEFVKLNFDFHPQWMQAQLVKAGFEKGEMLTASYLRAGVFKRALSLKTMVSIDSALQRTASLGLFSPSVFVKLGVKGERAPALPMGDDILRSPRSGQPLRRDGNAFVCDADGTRWHINGNFYDFKEPI